MCAYPWLQGRISTASTIHPIFPHRIFALPPCACSERGASYKTTKEKSFRRREPKEAVTRDSATDSAGDQETESQAVFGKPGAAGQIQKALAHDSRSKGSKDRGLCPQPLGKPKPAGRCDPDPIPESSTKSDRKGDSSQGELPFRFSQRICG